MSACAAGGGLGRSGAAYLTIGLLSVGIDVGLLVLLTEATGLPLPVATATAFLTSVLVNFTLNRLVFAGAATADIVAHAARYTALVVANLLVTVLVVTSAEAAGAPYVIAKLAVVAGSTLWNFLLYRHWVFR